MLKPTQSSDALSLTTMVAPVYVRLVLREAERLGISTERLCCGLGFAPNDLDVPGVMLSHVEATTVIQRTVDALGDAASGLNFGARTNIANRGALSLGLLSSATLQDALALALRFPSSAGFLSAMRELWSEDQHILFADPLSSNVDVLPFVVDFVFADLVRIIRQVTGAEYAPRAVELVRQRPPRAAPYQDYFDCTVRFGCSRNRLISKTSWLQHALPTADVMSFRLACQLLEREERAASGMSGIAIAVERAIRASLPRVPTPAEVAASLSFSERTLRRRLREAQLTFQGLLDEVRKRRALELMQTGVAALAHVAGETGFSDIRSFRRAFKRWTGRRPSEVQV